MSAPRLNMQHNITVLTHIHFFSFERLQYAEVSKTWTTEQGPSTTYGAEHLARLLGKIKPGYCMC